MMRVAGITLLTAILAVSLQAQRVGAGHGGGVPHAAPAGGRHPSGHGFAGVPSRGPNQRNRNRGVGAFPYFWPDYGYEAGGVEPEQVERPAPVQQVAAEPKPVPAAQVIEIPGVATAAKPLPPTVFILTNGEQVETQRYLLTSSNLSLTVQRRQRTIPMDMVNLDATIAANRGRGIELRIPDDRNEISLRF